MRAVIGVVGGLLAFLLVSGIFVGVPWWVLVRRPGWSPRTRRIGTVAFLAVVIAIPVGMLVGHGPSEWDPARIVGDTLIGVQWLFFSWSVMGAALGALALKFMLRSRPPRAADDPQERRAVKQRVWRPVALGVLAIVPVMTGLGVWGALKQPTLVDQAVTIKGLDPRLDGLRIVQLTDTHYAAIDRTEWSREMVRRINGLNPDVVVHVGDIADGSVEQRGAQVSTLAEVKAPHRGYVTGNHEYIEDAIGWMRKVEDLGWSVLHNGHLVVEKDGARLVLAGIDDRTATRYGLPGHGPDLDKALEGAPAAPVVLLAHQPKQVEQAKERNVALQLSGHTHGGQIWPFGYLVRLDQPVVSGLARMSEATQLYVSRGTGFWGPSLRLFAPSEITLITLRAG